MIINKRDWHAVYADDRASPWTPQAWKDYCEDGLDVDVQRKYRLSREPLLALKHLQLSPGDTVLEAGSGYGRITAYLLETGATVTGSDISPKMVEFCRQRFASFPSFSIDQFDIANLPFADETFDKVLCSGVLMHVNDYEKVVAELRRVLRVGGRLVISLNSPFCLLYQLGRLQSASIRLLKRLAGKMPQPAGVNSSSQSPLSVAEFLARQNLKLLAREADTLFCGDFRLAKFEIPVLPTFALSVYKSLDGFLCDQPPFSMFGWEVWYATRRIA